MGHPPGGAATPGFVQANSSTPTSAQTVSVPFPSNQTAGDMNIVVVGWNDTTSSLTSVTDSNNGGSSNGTATLVQKVANTGCSGTSATCSLTVAATGAGHILVVSASWAKNLTITGVSGGGSWVCPAAAVAADGTTLGSAMCYALSSTSGATTITVTSSAAPGSGIWVVEFREYNPTATVSFDTAGGIDDSASCTSCSGVSLTLGGTNDLIVQLISPANTVSAVSSGWGDTDFPGPNYIGVADKIGTSSGAAPTWTTTSGHATGSALAFQLGSTTGSNYTLAVGPTTVGSGVLGGAISQSIYYLPNIKGGANTVTVTFNQSASYPDVRVLEYSGLSTTSPLDVTAAGSGNGTAASSGAATTTSASELIFGANTVFTTTKSAGTGFTSRISTPDGDIAEDEDVASTGSYSATATLNSAGNWVMQMATFKAATTSGTSVYADVAYAPYGESYAQSGASDLSFTGQNNDTVSNLYDFLFREYHPVQGRWISPDPAGMAAVDPMNPESWNRYAYVGNSPLTAIDANGLVTLPGCEEGEFGCAGGIGLGCGALGGPEGDICTLLVPPLWRWLGGGGGSGSGGSGGGGTANGGSTGSGGGTSGSVGSGGRIANFPNGENLGLPPGVSGNWGGILGALLPIDPSCDFGSCDLIGMGFASGGDDNFGLPSVDFDWEILAFLGKGRRKGERRQTGKPGATPNPAKHARPSTKNPGRWEVKDPHTGKWILKPPGWAPTQNMEITPDVPAPPNDIYEVPLIPVCIPCIS